VFVELIEKPDNVFIDHLRKIIKEVVIECINEELYKPDGLGAQQAKKDFEDKVGGLDE
jgi:hypothetical protein